MQLGSEAPNAFAGPAQRRLRITSRGRLHERLQVLKQRGIFGGSAFTPCARTPHSHRLSHRCDTGILLNLTDTRADGFAGQARGAGYDTDASATDRQGFRRRPTPSGQLIEYRTQRFKFLG
jgi:hypothetical protein